MTGSHSYKSFLLIGILVFSFSATAQDTMRRRTVEVTSQFKPVLKDAAKINLNASPPTADTARPRLQYQIPNQNLQFVYGKAMELLTNLAKDNSLRARLGI